MQNELLWQSPERWIPHAYQKTAVKFLLQHAAGGLFLDPGLGKTTITLAALKLLFKAGTVSKVLVVAPLRVCFSVWPGEVEKWTDFNHLKVVVLHGPRKDELLKEEADIFVINPEGLDWLLQTKKTKGRTNKTVVNLDIRRFKRLGFDTLVIDELTKFKSHSSDRFKAMKLILGTFGRRWGLTGSPASNGLEPLFGQMMMLDQGRSLGAYITHYRRDFFVPAHNGFDYDLQPGAEDRIYERINPVVLRIGADGNIDMPQLVINDIWVDLDEKAMAIYLSLEEHLIAPLEDGSGMIVAKNRGVAIGQCRQLANGAIYKNQEVEALVKLPKTNREWSLIHEAKTEALVDLVESLQGNQVLIAYEFKHDVERLRKLFPDATFVEDIPAAKFKNLEKRWNDGEIPQLIAQWSSVSHGLNLQKKGNHIIAFCLTWDYENYDQFIRRVWRQGQGERRVFVHRILAKNTVDHAVVATLSGKAKGQNELFAALVKLRKSRKKRV